MLFLSEERERVVDCYMYGLIRKMSSRSTTEASKGGKRVFLIISHLIRREMPLPFSSVE